MAIPTDAMFMYAELEYECVEKDESKCQVCDERFKCWTSRRSSFQIVHLSMNRQLTGQDGFELDAVCPRCFKCGNMVGSKVTIHTEHDGMFNIFHGVILAQFLSAEGNEPMRLKIKGTEWVEGMSWR